MEEEEERKFQKDSEKESDRADVAGTNRPTEYPFLGVDAPSGNYNVFPKALENDPDIYFHGTAASVLKPIIANGFKPAKTLSSVSFSATSSLALGYACETRAAGEDGVVIAVRIETDNRAGIRKEAFGVHVDKIEPQPEIVGYCIIPASYHHI